MLRAFYHIKTDCDAMKMAEQHRSLYNFYHGNDPLQLINISLLYNRLHPYADIFEVVSTPLIVDSSSTVKYVTSHRINSMYSCCEESFYLKKDIKLLDLRQTDCTNTTVTTGRQTLRQARETMSVIKRQ